jgi:hypothetical protein
MVVHIDRDEPKGQRNQRRGMRSAEELTPLSPDIDSLQLVRLPTRPRPSRIHCTSPRLPGNGGDHGARVTHWTKECGTTHTSKCTEATEPYQGEGERLPQHKKRDDERV